jgi:phage tail-like protein
MAEATAEQDLYLAYRFKVDLGDKEAGWFCECSGLEVKVPAILYREGGSTPNEVLRLPSWTQYSDITLRYGVTKDHSGTLWQWLNRVSKNIESNPDEDHRDVVITLLDRGKDAGITWTLYEAWPTRVTARKSLEIYAIEAGLRLTL